MKKAFTLIELLVVIAIIAILAAILFPVFAQAKAAAKKTAALSSVKETALANLMYSGDSDDKFPMGLGNDWITALDGGWAWDTQPYIKSLPLLQDPSDPKSKFFWQSWFSTPPTPAVSISFAGNGFIHNNTAVGLLNLCQTKDMTGQPTRNNPGGMTGWLSGTCSVSQTQISHIADSIMFSSHYAGNNYYGPGSSIITGKPWWDGTGPGAAPDPRVSPTVPYTISNGSSSYTANANGQYGAVSVYTNQGIFAFADGHAKTMNPLQTIGPVSNDDSATTAQEALNLWDAQRP